MFCFPKAGKTGTLFLEELKQRSIPVKKIPKNHKLMEEGEKNDRLIVLTEGYAKISRMDNNGHIRLLALAHDQVLGVAGFFNKGVYPSTVTTLTDCLIYEVSYDLAIQMIEENKSIRQYLFRLMDQFVTFYICNAVMQSYDSVDVQLARILYDMAVEIGKTQENGHIRLPIAMTDEFLGNLLGSSRETVTRLLGKWRDEGIIIKKNRFLTIVELKEIEKIINR